MNFAELFQEGRVGAYPGVEGSRKGQEFRFGSGDEIITIKTPLFRLGPL
jgi:hypothetical protein